MPNKSHSTDVETTLAIRRFFDFSPTLLAIFNEKGDLTLANQMFKKYLPAIKSLSEGLPSIIEGKKVLEIDWTEVPMDGKTYVIGRDVTLERSRKRFLESLVDNLPLALFAKDAQDEFRFVQWNKQAESFFGLKKEQVLGKNDFDFFPREEAEHFREKDIETLSNTKVLAIAEEPVTSPSQETRWVRTYKIGLTTKGSTPNILLGISEDVTELRRQTEKAREQRAQLLAAAKLSSLGEMAAGVAHEINNPLAILKGKVNRMHDKAEAEEMTLKDLAVELVKIDGTIDRIARIVKGLMTFGRAAEHDPFEVANLKEVVESSLEITKERYREHGIELSAQVPDDIFLDCRPGQISQVITNLFNNSFDSICGKPGAWVEITCDKVGEAVRICISDSGKGIPPEIAENIFNPFFSTKEVGKGTGLGLSIARGIIEEHRGNIYYDKDSMHTRFVIELPVHSMLKASGA